MSALRLPASEASLPALRQLAMDAAKAAGLSEADQLRVDLVLEEALVNIIRHAYSHGAQDGAPEAVLSLDCETDPDGVLRLTLTDWGPAFDPIHPDGPGPEDAPAGEEPAAGRRHLLDELEANREADLDSRAPGGLGLLFIRSMSEASYAREHGANVLRLRFPPRAEA